MFSTNSDVQLRDRLTAFAPAVENVSLYLLRAITQTVDTLQLVEKMASATSEGAERMCASISEQPAEVGIYLDPDDKAIGGIEAGYRVLEENLPKLLLGKSAIDADSGLDGEHAELLHIAYDRCIDSIACLIESIKNLRAAIISHDLAAEPPATQIFESTSELIESLRTHA